MVGCTGKGGPSQKISLSGVGKNISRSTTLSRPPINPLLSSFTSHHAASMTSISTNKRLEQIKDHISGENIDNSVEADLRRPWNLF
jgi:hypothetical protein